MRNGKVLQVFAHRGYRTKYPENTKTAFQKALSLGVHGIELDLRLTRDGKGVIIHDATVDRTSDGTGQVERMTLAEIKALDAGKWLGEELAGQRFLSLEEAFALLPPPVQLNIHLKTPPDSQDELVEYAVDRMIGHEMLKTAFLSCERPALERARQLEPRIRGCYLGPQPRNTVEFIEASLSLGCRIIQLPHEQVHADFVARAHQRGIEVNALHLETPAGPELRPDGRELYQRLVQCDVDGIITDYPDFWLQMAGK